MDQKIVALVEARAGHYCETCGRPALDSMALHHRKLKSRGGKDSASNLVRIHHECHNFETDSIHMKPTQSRDKGWMVSSWADPELEPFLQPDGQWVLLKNDGSIESV